MFKKISLKAKILMGSSITLVILAIIGFISNNSIKHLNQTSDWVQHTYKVIAQANNILESAINMETGMRGYLLAGKEEFLDPYKDGQKKFSELVSSLSNTVSDNPAQVQLLAEIKDVIGKWNEKVTEPEIALRRQIGDAKSMNDMAAQVRKKEGKVYFDKFRGQVAVFVNREEKLLEERKSSLKQGNVSSGASSEAANWVEHTYKVILSANKILESAINMETGVRGYLLAGMDEFLEPYNQGKKEFYEHIDALSKTVSDNPSQVQLLSEIKSTITDWDTKVVAKDIALRKEIGDSKTMDDIARIEGEAKGKEFFDKFRGMIATFIGREQKLLEERNKAAIETTNSASLTIVGGIICAILIAIAVSLLLSSAIIKPIRQIFMGLKTFSAHELETVREQFAEVLESLSTGADMVSSASQNIASGSSQQAASLEETSSSLEEMSTMTNANAESASQADNLMKTANKVVERANLSMNDLTKAMNEITKASEETSKIIKTIDEIAFQTNLLALNAAVEAARAGEAGAGFAVVADEVRNLAMRASEAAKNTSTLIDGTVKKIKEGSDLVLKTNEAFNEVSSTSSKVGGLVAEISAASNEQSAGISQVNKAVAEMDKIVQSNAAATEELSSQAEELNQNMGVMVQILQGDNGRRKTGTTTKKQMVSGGKASSKKQLSLSTTPRKSRTHTDIHDNVLPMNNEDAFRDF